LPVIVIKLIVAQKQTDFTSYFLTKLAGKVRLLAATVSIFTGAIILYHYLTIINFYKTEYAGAAVVVAIVWHSVPVALVIRSRRPGTGRNISIPGEAQKLLLKVLQILRHAFIQPAAIDRIDSQIFV